MISMKNFFTAFSVMTLPLSTFCLTVPVEHQSAPIWKREEMITADGKVCVESSVDAPGGMLYCYDGLGNGVSCSDCMSATSESVTCIITSDHPGDLGTTTACPGDPAPATLPDGTSTSDMNLSASTVKVFCDGVLSWPGPAIVDILLKPAVCLTYAHYMANGDPAEDAINAATFVCDAPTLGACSFFTKYADYTKDPGCTNPDDSNLCDFAAPGK